MTAPLAVIILAAGKGSRMKSDLPKVMHRLAGRPLLGWVLAAVASLQPERIIVVTAPGMGEVAAFAGDTARIAVQDTARGTADAVRAALPQLDGFAGDVLVLLGDVPLIATGALRGLIDARHGDGVGLAAQAVNLADPAGFGRVLLDADGTTGRIVEDKDCTPQQKSIALIATGAYCVEGAGLARWTAKIGNDNPRGEYGFPDIVPLAAADGVKTGVRIIDDQAEGRGINSRGELAQMESVVQARLRAGAMANGATLLDPQTVYFSWDTTLGRDVTIEPNVFFGPGVTVGDGVHVKAFSHLEGAQVAAGAVVGPFARLRPGAVIGRDAHIGNFVEIKNATLGPGAKANHHAYIGDADIGAGTNYGCGAITANYDGRKKHRTTIGAQVMVGSNVTLVAPVTVGDGAYLAAGSTITKDVPAEALAVARTPQKIREGWAKTKKAIN